MNPQEGGTDIVMPFCIAACWFGYCLDFVLQRVLFRHSGRYGENAKYWATVARDWSHHWCEVVGGMVVAFPLR